MALTPLELPRFEMHADSGAVVLRDGIVVTFFVPLSHRAAIPTVHSTIARYLAMSDMPEALWLLDDEGYPQQHEAPKAASLVDVALHKAASECDFWLADQGNNAPRFRIRYHGLDLDRRRSEGWPCATSGVSFAFPSDYLGQAGLPEVFNFANETARQLPFSFGLVSPAFVQAEGSLESAAFESMRRLARRYRCFEIPALLPDCFESANAPKGAYWGNYFGGSLLEALGGEYGLRASFADAEVRLEGLGTASVSVYLDPLPIAGDVNRQEDLSRYRRAFEVVRSRLPEREVRYMNFDEEAFEAWMCRFDGQER
jgi:Protein of unknown function (DUF3396)